MVLVEINISECDMIFVNPTLTLKWIMPERVNLYRHIPTIGENIR